MKHTIANYEKIIERANDFRDYLRKKAQADGQNEKTLIVYYNALDREWAGELNRAGSLEVNVKACAFSYEVAEDFREVADILKTKKVAEAGANFKRGVELYLEYLEA